MANVANIMEQMEVVSSDGIRTLARNGYRGIAARNCSPGTYVFHAIRNNRKAIVYVNARTGAV